jgi:hypothetical protein
MPSFAVRYRSRGQLREVRWADGRLSAEPLVRTIVEELIRERRVVRAKRGAPSFFATLDQAEPAALTILEALYDVGAHILHWEGDPRGLGDDRSGNQQMR